MQAIYTFFGVWPPACVRPSLDSNYSSKLGSYSIVLKAVIEKVLRIDRWEGPLKLSLACVAAFSMAAPIDYRRLSDLEIAGPEFR